MRLACIYSYTYTHIDMYIIFIRSHCECVCVCACIYIYIYIYMHKHIHIFRKKPGFYSKGCGFLAAALVFASHGLLGGKLTEDIGLFTRTILSLEVCLQYVKL